MRRAARGGEDHLEAAVFRRGRVDVRDVGRPVRGHHPDFVRNAEFVQRFVGLGDEGPVGIGAHDESDGGRGGFLAHGAAVYQIPRRKETDFLGR